jgi:hypothetical protein
MKTSTQVVKAQKNKGPPKKRKWVKGKSEERRKEDGAEEKGEGELYGG